jgi:hypothetical protein
MAPGSGPHAPAGLSLAHVGLLFVVLFVAALVILLLASRPKGGAGHGDVLGGVEAFVGGARRRRDDLLVSEPGYSEMRAGTKTVVGRLRTGMFAPEKLRLKAGDPVVVVRSHKKDSPDRPPPHRYRTKVVRVTDYPSAAALVKAEKKNGATEKEFAEPFYTAEQRKDLGAVAVQVAPPAGP